MTITYHFSGPGTAISRVCVSVYNIMFELDKL